MLDCVMVSKSQQDVDSLQLASLCEPADVVLMCCARCAERVSLTHLKLDAHSKIEHQAVQKVQGTARKRKGCNKTLNTAVLMTVVTKILVRQEAGLVLLGCHVTHLTHVVLPGHAVLSICVFLNLLIASFTTGSSRREAGQSLTERY